jgi:hypothetical protein
LPAWSATGSYESADGERATPKKAARRNSPPDTYLNSMNGKRRPKHGKKGKVAKGYYLQELTALQEELVKPQYWVKQKSLKSRSSSRAATLRERVA